MFEVNPVLAKVEELKQRTSVIKGYVSRMPGMIRKDF